MKVRKIALSDREAYRQLRATLDIESSMWGASPGERDSLGDYAGSQFDQVLCSARSAIFVAEEEGAVIGFLSLETSAWKSLSCTTTLMVGVLSSNRGKGVSSQLFECSQRWASNEGIHRIELLVLVNNVSAIRLYKKLGYAQEGIRKESSYLGGKFVDEIFMAKLLQ